MKSMLWCLLVACLCPWSGRGAAVPDREGAVRRDRAAVATAGSWVYNDVERGFAEARRSGRPVLVVFRCVPCLACAGLDTQVLLEAGELQPLLDRFVRVRVINANALDLTRFQFDYDLSFSALFFHGDGTLYGRYGSWVHQTNAQERATAGLRRALEAVLALHRDYPANRASLAGKQGVPGPFRTPLEIPTLDRKYRAELDWNGKVVPSCVHCHQIADALRLQARAEKGSLPDALVFPYPAPETIGLGLALDAVARVDRVEPGSPAARAGLRAGDELVTLEGQPLVSSADVSWVLHGLPRGARLRVGLRRAGRLQEVVFDLPEGWRTKADGSRRVGTWGMRGMATGGMVLEDLADAERRALGLALDAMALRVKHVGEYGKHAAAKQAGFRKDDILVSVQAAAGDVPPAGRLSEGALIGWILQGHPAGSSLRARVLRGEKALELQIPVQ